MYRWFHFIAERNICFLFNIATVYRALINCSLNSRSVRCCLRLLRRDHNYN